MRALRARRPRLAVRSLLSAGSRAAFVALVLAALALPQAAAAAQPVPVLQIDFALGPQPGETRVLGARTTLAPPTPAPVAYDHVLVLEAPKGPLEAVPVSLSGAGGAASVFLPWKARYAALSRLRLERPLPGTAQRKTVAVFSLPAPLCRQDGVCASAETVLSCPSDCSLERDGLCTPLADGVCDRDCAAGVDRDCGRGAAGSSPTGDTAQAPGFPAAALAAAALAFLALLGARRAGRLSRSRHNP